MNFPSTSLRPAVALLVSGAAFTPLISLAAGLPTMEDPSRGAGSGIMQTLQNYGYDIVLLIALLVVASMFVGVCYHAYTRYAEIHTGRATWGPVRVDRGGGRHPAGRRHLAADQGHRRAVKAGSNG